MNKKKKTIFLIDGNSICYRAYYAIKELSTSKGVPTNAVYGFTSMVNKLLREHSPDKLVMVFDMPGPTTRHAKYESYKIHRKPMPDDLAEQLSMIRDVTVAYNIPICQKEGYEADDVIATIAEKAEKKGFNVVVVTSDKDALQLINDNIRVLSPHTSGGKIYDAGAVMEKFGVKPDRMVELMALMGDASDNIPGVKGVGKVTAEKLIAEFGSVAGLYERIDEIPPGALRKKLEEGRDMAVLSRELAELQKDVPVGTELDLSGDMPGADITKLTELFKELEFGKFLRDLGPREDIQKKKYSILSGKDAVSRIKELKKTASAAMCLSASPGRGVEGAAFSTEKDGTFFVEFARNEDLFSGAGGLLKDIFEFESLKKIGHDMKNDIRVLNAEGIELKGVLFDIMIADYLADPSISSHGLEDMAMRRGGYNLFAAGKDVPRKRAPRDGVPATAAADALAACERCEVILKLYRDLERELDERSIRPLFDNVEMPLVRVIADMEDAGVGIDVKYLEKMSAVLDGKLSEVSRRIYELAGEEFNINSSKQLQEILFGKLGLPPGRRTKTGISTDESVLVKLAAAHELPKALLEYRQINKLKTAYYDSMKDMADKKDGRLHARFNQAVTATGRLSSSEPNLQNIPIKTELGREIRRAFVACSKKAALLAADYSQVELRVLAHLSGDENLLRAFRDGEDVHTFTASLIYDCSQGEVTGKMRSTAKTVNFGIIYGMSSFGLAKDLDISVEEANGFISAYFKRYSGVSDFIKNTIERTRKEGYVTTLLKRRRYIPEIRSANERVRSFAERAAVNTAVQGTAADMIKLAMIGCARSFAGSATRMIIQVHDELVFDTPLEGIKDTAGEVRKIMENVIELSVPLRVDIEWGRDWLNMKEV